MRTTGDRIRHSLIFEAMSFLIVTPAGGWIYGIPMTHFGVVALASATMAMIWNYAFNLGFDHALLRLRGNSAKTLAARVVHAVLFELGMTLLLVPFIAWYLDLSLWAAFVMDVSLACFYAGYAFVFNWGYDILFPAPADRPARS